MNDFKKLYCYLCSILGVVLITGCISPVSSTIKQPNTSEYITRAEITPYLEQWNDKKDSLERLSALEGDLQVLFDALSATVNIAELPESLREELLTVEHKPHNKSESSSSKVFVNLGTYFNASRANSALKNFNIRFPALSDVINIMVDTRRNDKGVRYMLVGRQLPSVRDAEQLCKILRHYDQQCELVSDK